MRSLRWIRTMPMIALLVAALAAFVGGGCGDDRDDNQKPPANTGGTGGDAGGGGGGAGGDGGTPVTPCEDHDDCQAWERCDEKEKICVPKCTRDRECGLNTGLRCDTETGLCVPGEPCDQSFNCGTHRDFDYCKTARCYCQPDESMQNGDPPRNGVCWRLSSICSECESDEECEGGSSGVCVPYNYNGETRNVCLRKPSGAGSCPPGLVRGQGDAEGLCVPQYGDCGRFKPCESDDDCDQLNPVCDLARQVCIPGCTFNFISNRTVGCPPERVCHMTEASINQDFLGDCSSGHLWGVGRCGTECESDEHCAVYGKGFVCEQYGNEHRCVPPEAARKDDFGNRIGCMSDDECALGDPSRPERGFCDFATFTCMDTCRLGPDWRNGCNEPFPDCGETHKCVPNPAEPDNAVHGICEKKTCVDVGGAEIGCRLGEFCAGEFHTDPFTGERSETEYVQAPQGVNDGECFPMDEAKWCVECNAPGDCVDMTDLTYKRHLDKPESERPPYYPGVCISFQGGNFCAPGCVTRQDCPAGWACTPVGFTPCGSGLTPGLVECTGDGDCPNDTKCVEAIVKGKKFSHDRLASVKLCACDPSKAGQCGAGMVCNAGIGTMAEGGTVQQHYCMEASACGPNGSCEFLGRTEPSDPNNSNSNHLPIYECANDGGVMPGVTVECPEGTFRGPDRAHRHECVQSNVCWPKLRSDGTCGVFVPED